MSTAFRFVAVSPGRVEDKKKIGTASFLHDFLVDHQTDAAGRVNYGKAIGYAWIRAHWLAAPPIRTLKWQMAKLKRAGLVEIRVLGFGGGMLLRLIDSAKWKKSLPRPAEQLPLISNVKPIREKKAVENPVDKQWESECVQISHGARNCPRWGQKVAP